MTALLVIGMAPLIWSAILSGARRLAGPRYMPQDGVEKIILGLMLAPVLLGFAFVVIAPFLPVNLSAPVFAYTGLDDHSSGAIAMPTLAKVKVVVDWPGLVLRLVVALYVGGAGFGVARLLWAQSRLLRIVAKSTALASDEGVRATGSAVPAFVFGRLIIPPQSLLRELTQAQVALIIAHERAHLARGDTFYFAALSWIDAMFWFNPFVRGQTRNGRLAAELACDAAVTRDCPHMRKAYAASLLTALKHTAGDVRQYAPAAISTSNSGEFQMRLSEIMHASSAVRKPRWLIPGLAALLILPLAGLQLAWAQTAAPKAPAMLPAKTEATASPALLFSVMPTAGNLTSGYGNRTNPVTHKPSFHNGIDIAAAIGTPVYAPAAGQVTRADLAEPGYGKVLIIDHGNGLITRYMHLGEFEVQVGDEVQAGQLIAKSGNSGRSTGPHTHIGVFRDGKPIDPATIMPLPAAS